MTDPIWTIDVRRVHSTALRGHYRWTLTETGTRKRWTGVTEGGRTAAESEARAQLRRILVARQAQP